MTESAQWGQVIENFILNIWQMTKAHMAHGFWDMTLGLLCQVSSARYKTLTHWVSTDTFPGARGQADQEEVRIGGRQTVKNSARKKEDQGEG